MLQWATEEERGGQGVAKSLTNHHTKDVRILRDLARQYVALTQKPIQQERRELWSDLLSLRPTRPLILATYGMWNVWCREVFGDAALQCEDPFFREHERTLRMALFQDTVGDDYILEPWITQEAAKDGGWARLFGVEQGLSAKPGEGARRVPAVHQGLDAGHGQASPRAAPHRRGGHGAERRAAPGGDRRPAGGQREPRAGLQRIHGRHLVAPGDAARVGTDDARYVESPRELHALAAFVRDAALAAQDAAEAAGDYGLTNHGIQEMPYSRELEWPRANARPAEAQGPLGFCAAQEFALVSPAMHDEFLLRYQIPIMSRFGLAAYGCCEDLTRKIGMLGRFRTCG